MSDIQFNLLQSTSLRCMVPAQAAAGFGVAQLPATLAGAGTYVIVNTHTNNRYVGISSQLQVRFGQRLAMVTELGFSVAQMDRIHACWGNVLVQDTANNLNPAPPVQPHAPGAGGGFLVPVDNILINAEHLLIRMCLVAIGAGGTVSNNQHVIPFANNTPHPMTVTFSWAALGNVYAAGAHQTVIGAHGLL